MLSRSIAIARPSALEIPFVFHLLAASLLLCALGARIWVKLSIVDVGYELSREHAASLELDHEKSELELHRSVLLRHDMLLRQAKTRLGVEPTTTAYVYRISAP